MSVQTFLTKTQNTILSAALILSVSSGISALLGVIKNRLLAGNFGVSNDLAIFYTSDYIPNLIYSVLIVGAISTIFIPIFTGALKRNREEAFRTASSIINTTLLFFALLGFIVYIFAPQIFTLLSFGKFSSAEVNLGTNLMRIMLASQLILVLGSLATSVLQSQRLFLFPALAPIVYNIGMIMGIVFLTPYYGIYGPAFGVLIGALLHFSVQIPILIKTGFTYTFSLNLRDRSLTKMFALIPPRILSVLVANLIQTINNSLAILISPSSVIVLKFANQLQGFPVNLFGFSIAAASLPTLSAQNSKEDSALFKRTLLTSFHQMMFLVLPLSMILFILRVPVVRLVYGVANFPWHATVETAATLAIFSVSIFSQSANYLLTRAFYALKDTVTPILIAAATALLNIALSVIMVWVLKYGVWSVALAFSVTSILDTAILFYFLDRKTGGIPLIKILGPFSKISLATFCMGVTLYAPIKLLDQVIFDTSRTVNLFALTVIAGLCGAFTYLLFTKLFKVEEIALFYKLVRKLNFTPKNLKVEELPYQDQDKPQL